MKSKTYLYDNLEKHDVSGFLDSEFFDAIYVEFDEVGQLILRENFLDYRGKLGLFDRTIYRYNNQNKIEFLENTLIQNGEEPKRIAQQKKFYYTYDRLIRIDEFNSGRNHDQIWTTNYYPNQSMIEHWMGDEIYSKKIQQINLANQIIATQTVTNDQKIKQKENFDYDQFGNIVQHKTIYGQTEVIENYLYNQNQILRYELIRDDEFKSIEYNDNGLPKNVYHRFNHQNIDRNFSFKYQYDQSNNWIECEISINHIPKFKIKRSINYNLKSIKNGRN